MCQVFSYAIQRKIKLTIIAREREARRRDVHELWTENAFIGESPEERPHAVHNETDLQQQRGVRCGEEHRRRRLRGQRRGARAQRQQHEAALSNARHDERGTRQPERDLWITRQDAHAREENASLPKERHAHERCQQHRPAKPWDGRVCHHSIFIYFIAFNPRRT